MDDIHPEQRTTPIGLWHFAKSYLDAAKHLAENTGLGFDAPIYFLYCHAIELTLKAYLRAQGARLDELKSFGHALPLLLERALAQGLDQGASAENEAAILELVDVYNQGHEFRYIVTGSKVLPTLNALHEVAARLLSAGRDACALNATTAFRR
jgi:hypothetical protein